MEMRRDEKRWSIRRRGGGYSRYSLVTTFLLLAVAWRPAGELPRLEEAPALRALTHCDGRWGRACWATSAAELRRGFLDKRGRSVVDLPTDPPKEEEEEEEEEEEVRAGCRRVRGAGGRPQAARP